METGEATATPAPRGTGRSGPRASLACMNCRQRKIKCRMTDPNSAACHSCRSLDLPCIVNKDGDRRKAGSRQHVAALQERLDYLESYIANQNAAAPDSVTAISSSAFASNVGPPPMGVHMPSFDGSTASARRSSNLPDSQGSQSSPQSAMSNVNNLMYMENDVSPGQALPGRQSRQADLGRLTPSSDKETNRLQLDEADGGPRFYGPTSQAHIHRQSVPVESEDHVAQDEGLNIDSTPLRTAIFSTYWKIQPHSIVMVDESLFLEGREGRRRSEYYSAFLEDALLASATRMSTSGGVRALGPKFVERAKASIADELERPNTATLQAFLLLSDFEATRGRDRLGYLYCGIGCRLVFDLGLHESCADLVSRGKMAPHEAMWRHTLFLGSYVYDKLWSLYTGRPGTIPIATVDVAHSRALASGWLGPASLDPWVRLSSDISEATDILNGTSPLNDEAKERLVRLDERIQRRPENLPLELMLNKDRVSDLPPSAYSLHIQFHGIRIILHRLLYKTATHQAIESPSDADHRNFNLEHSRAIMYENATQIAQLVSVYQQIFGIEQVITIMLDNSYVAAVVLVSHLLRVGQMDPAPPGVDRDMQRLRALAELLSKAQKHYPVTVRMRFSLASHVENTPMAGIFGTFAHNTHEPQNATVTELPSNTPAHARQTLPEASADLFQDFNPGRADMALFEDWGGDTGESIYQEMDMQNMLSWALSPHNTRTDLAFQ